MNTTAIYFGIMGALLVGAISPGPSFVLVCRTTMLHSRNAGLAAALGMGIGGAIFGCLTLFGLATLLKEVPSLYLVLKMLGGTYLLYLAFRIWRGATQALDVQVGTLDREQCSLSKMFWISLMTQLSNPKTAVVYGSIFTAFLPADPPMLLLVALVPGFFIVEFLWYTVVALVFSHRKPREVYLSGKTKIDRVVATILGLLGGRLIYEAFTD
jgi:threonine/homoserine/homoserine lactone efflux protein